MEEKVLGIVVKSIDYRENDKLLTLFTDCGKKTSLLKGCKKASAKLKFAGEPFCLGEFIIWNNGQYSTVIECSLIDLFYDLRKDLKKLYSAYTVLEILQKAVIVGDDCKRVFSLAVETLKNICYRNHCEYTSLAYFMTEFLEISGYKINFDSCSACGKPLNNKVFYSASEKAFVCNNCGGVAVDEKVVKTLTDIKDCKINENSGIRVKAAETVEVIELLTEYLQNCLDIKVNSTQMLKKII